MDGGPVNLTGVFNGLAAGPHSVVITDLSSGCTGSASVNITQPTAILASIGSQANVLCNGGATGSFLVNASGGTPSYTYSKDGGVNYQASNAFTNLTAGTYSIIVKDSKGCTVTVLATVTQLPAVSGSVSGITGTSCGLSDGTATITGTGGTSPYTFNLDNTGYGSAASSQTFSGLSAGNHVVIVQDANNCTSAAVNFNISSSTRGSCSTCWRWCLHSMCWLINTGLYGCNTRRNLEQQQYKCSYSRCLRRGFRYSYRECFNNV